MEGFIILTAYFGRKGKFINKNLWKNTIAVKGRIRWTTRFRRCVNWLYHFHLEKTDAEFSVPV
jgi:hypothetical protein